MTRDLARTRGARPGDPLMSAALVAEHGLSPEEWEQILGFHGAGTHLHGTRRVQRHVVGALRVQELAAPAPHTANRERRRRSGPGRERRGHRRGRRLGRRVQDRVHNHPSAVETLPGAATGSGGILRDVFTMGARPIAIFDSLHFGSLDSPQSRYLFDGVVRGVGDYGNCVGVPTVGGEAIFDPAYERNPLINVMCIGVLPLERLIRGEAEGVGNPGDGGRRPHGAGRDPRGDVRVGGTRRGGGRQPAAGAGGRPVHRETPPRGKPRTHRAGPPGRQSRTWGRPD